MISVTLNQLFEKRKTKEKNIHLLIEMLIVNGYWNAITQCPSESIVMQTIAANESKHNDYMLHSIA